MNKLGSIVRFHLLQSDTKDDPGFVGEVSRLRRIGLQVYGVAAILVPICLLLARGLTQGKLPALPGASIYLGISVLGVTVLCLGRTEWSRNKAALIGWLAVFFTCGLLVWNVYVETTLRPDLIPSITPRLSTVILISVFVLSLHPMHTLSVGLAIEVFFLFSDRLAVAWGLVPADGAASPDAFTGLFVLVGLSVALSAVMYRRVYRTYSAHQRELRAADDLRQTQSLLVVSENAATMGRFAATLSHELNSPVGALVSVVQTLQSLHEKRGKASGENRARLDRMEEDLLGSAHESADRLRDIVARMQRLTNLDRAEILAVDLNELLRDVLEMMQSQLKDKIEIELDLHPLPRTTVRPQQISAVFSNLLQSTAERFGTPARILITSKRANGFVHIDILHRDKRLAKEEVDRLFDPGFGVKDRRIAAANWGLFSSREMVRRHGGDILALGSQAAGTSLRVTIPC